MLKKITKHHKKNQNTLYTKYSSSLVPIKLNSDYWHLLKNNFMSDTERKDNKINPCSQFFHKT